jgi:RHS repeat-associated protein
MSFAEGSLITLQFPAGTVVCQGQCGRYYPYTSWYATDDTTGQSFGATDCSYNYCSGTTITVPVKNGVQAVVVNAGDHVTVVVNGLINPPPGTYQLEVSTSSDPTAVASNSYTTVANNPVSNVTASITGPTAAAGGLSGYTVGFNLSATGGMSNAVGSVITLQFPAGTVVCGACGHYYPNTSWGATDDTTGQSFGATDCSYNYCSGTTITIPVKNGVNTVQVNAGDHITVTVNGLLNPPPGTYQLQVSTSSDTTPVASNSYTTVANNPVSNVIPSASSSAPGAQSNYTIGFNVSATGGMSNAVSSFITLQFPAGTGIGSTNFGAIDDTTGQSFGATDCSYGYCSGTTITIHVKNGVNSVVVNAGDHITARVDNAVNPPNPGSSPGQVSTSSDTTLVPFNLFGPIGGPETPQQNPADFNVAQKSSCSCQDTGVRSASRVGHIAYPINAASGAFWHSFTDFAIPGRGLPLNLTRTYSSVFAGVNGPLGFGWTISYLMSLTIDQGTGDVTVHQENGSQVTFTPGSGGSYSAPPRFTATLVKNVDGTFTFMRDAKQTFTFSATGQLTRETDLNGYATTFTYDGSGQLTTVTDPAGRSLTFTWSGGHVVAVKDPIGRLVTFSYDGNGNLVAARDVAGGITKFTYDGNHLVSTMTDPRGGVVTNTYDSQGRIVKQTDPLNNATTYAYSGDNFSGSGGTTTITDPNGNVTVERYQYGLLVSETRGYGTSSAATWTYSYDPATLGITKETDPNGHVTTKAYDANGNLLSRTDPLGRKTIYTYNSLNEPVTVTDPLGITTTNTYDSHGNLLSTSTPIGSSTASTTYSYGDSAHPGDVTAMTDPNGHTWTYTYDGQGDRASGTDPAGDKTSYTYNTIGERLTMVSPRGFTSTYTYTPFGDLATVTDPLGNKTTSSYDPNRNLVKVVDPSRNITTNTYDHDNELTQTVHAAPNGTVLQTLRTTYDGDGNVLQQINGLGVATETYAYDPLSRVKSATDALNRTTSYTYDGAGNRLMLVDPSGRTTRYSYDAANELTGFSYSDGTTPAVSYSYDADGQRLTMTDGTGTTSYTHDSLNRLTKDVQGDGQVVSYAYDLAGNLTQITYPNGHTVTRTYDVANRLASVVNWLAAPNTVNFAYDADSNLTTQTYPNGVIASLTYDSADQLKGILDKKGAKTLLHLAYIRNPDSLVKKEATRTFGYDALNRLTTDSLATSSYSYDPADELTKLAASTGTTTFSYDSASQLTSSTTTAGTTTYSYDSQGNRTGAIQPSSQPVASGYDQANRLTSFSQGTTIASYAYNGDGLRMSKTVDAAAEPFAWDVAEGLPHLLGDGATSYVTGPHGLPLEQITSGGSVLFYHQDQLGSTRMLTDSAGSVQATYTYAAYGSLSSSSGSVSQPFRYAGEYGDSESGLYYLRARYYDPVSGQFVTVDPAVGKTNSPYAYVAGDVVNHTDPTGRSWDLPGGLCVWMPFQDNSHCESFGNILATPPPGKDYGTVSVSILIVEVNWTTTASGAKFVGVGVAASPVPASGAVFYNDVYHPGGARASNAEVDSYCEGLGVTGAIGAIYGADLGVSNSINNEAMGASGEGATTPNASFAAGFNWRVND